MLLAGMPALHMANGLKMMTLHEAPVASSGEPFFTVADVLFP
jgi:hypothetical protein